MKKIILLITLLCISMSAVAGHHWHERHYRGWHEHYGDHDRGRSTIVIGAPGIFIGWHNRQARIGVMMGPYGPYRRYSRPPAEHYYVDPNAVYYAPPIRRVEDICVDQYGYRYVCGYHYER